jgi:Protein of unknown function (DUF2934)
MVKSSKKSKETAAPEINPVALDQEARNGNGLAEAAKPAAAKSPSVKVAKSASRPKSPGKTRSAKPGKTPATRQPRAAATSKRKAAPASVMIPEEEIRMRAYFIAERRMREGIHGNSADDWLEARRQLLVEAGHRA